jgi:ribose transport system substrate-binding protein
MKIRLSMGTIALVAVVPLLVLSGCGASTATTKSTAKSHSYVVGLSNSFFGNATRVEMEKIVEAEAKQSPWKKMVKKLIIMNAGNNVAEQIANIDTMISEHVNAILVDAASPTGLNSAIAEAKAHGIVVVGYDNVPSSPDAIDVEEPMVQYSTDGMTWLAHTLHGTGNIVVIRGVAGTYDDTLEATGIANVLKAYPGIHVLNTSFGNWDEADAETVMSGLLSSFSNIDGVYTEGGELGGVLAAFTKAGRKFVPATGGSLNGTNEAWEQDISKGFVGWAVTPDVWQSAYALNTALNVLSGKHEPKVVTAPLVTMTNATVSKYTNAHYPSDMYLDVGDPAVGVYLTPKEVTSQPNP